MRKKVNNQKLTSKRISIVLAIFSVLTFSIMLRIAYLQVIQGKWLSIKASEQRFSDTRVEKMRGFIFDRNMIPIVNRQVKTAAVIKPQMIKDIKESVITDLSKENVSKISKIASLIGMDEEEFEKSVSGSTRPIIYELTDQQAEKILKYQNIYSDEAINNLFSTIKHLGRYDSNAIARHVVGYLGRADKNGQAGIEKKYEDVLVRGGDSYIGVVTDAKHNPIPGMGYRVVKTNGDGVEMAVKLTIDYHIQRIVENIMRQEQIMGAVVVEDVDTGDIVALASMPDYDQNRVENYLYSKKQELFNRATGAYDLGSVFKIIVAAAALEEGVVSPESEFFCNGYVDAGSTRIKCSNDQGHGHINMTEAFSKSCNPTFVEIGLLVGPKKIIEMAQKFGLGSLSGIKEQGIPEANGVLPTEKFFSKGAIGNMSIGQGNILVTPIQVVDMISTIASGGIKSNINIVDSIVNGEGNVIRKIRQDGAKRVISRETAIQIQRMMENATKSGTAKKANIDQYGGSGGKTGSAQTGRLIGDEKVVQAWFAGYFPLIEPRYSICVFVENGKAGGTAAAPIFKLIAQEIMKKKL